MQTIDNIKAFTKGSKNCSGIYFHPTQTLIVTLMDSKPHITTARFDVQPGDLDKASAHVKIKTLFKPQPLKKPTA